VHRPPPLPPLSSGCGLDPTQLHGQCLSRVACLERVVDLIILTIHAVTSRTGVACPEGVVDRICLAIQGVEARTHVACAQGLLGCIRQQLQGPLSRSPVAPLPGLVPGLAVSPHRPLPHAAADPEAGLQTPGVALGLAWPGSIAGSTPAGTPSNRTSSAGHRHEGLGGTNACKHGRASLDGSDASCFSLQWKKAADHSGAAQETGPTTRAGDLGWVRSGQQKLWSVRAGVRRGGSILTSKGGFILMSA
jgi:hypothetical protein